MTLKTALLTPTPRAMVRIAVTENGGGRGKARSAWRIHPKFTTGRGLQRTKVAEDFGRYNNCGGSSIRSGARGARGCRTGQTRAARRVGACRHDAVPPLLQRLL